MTREIAAEDGVVWSVAFSPDGSQLATASSDELVVLWDPQTGDRIATMTGHTGGAPDVAFLPDGVTLAATDRKGGIHFSDLPPARRRAERQQAPTAASWR